MWAEGARLDFPTLPASNFQAARHHHHPHSQSHSAWSTADTLFSLGPAPDHNNSEILNDRNSTNFLHYFIMKAHACIQHTHIGNILIQDTGCTVQGRQECSELNVEVEPASRLGGCSPWQGPLSSGSSWPS